LSSPVQVSINQDRVLGGAHHIGLVRHHHFAGRRIEHLAIELGEMAAADLGIVFRKHFLRRAPRAVPFNDAGNRDVANRELVHAGLTNVSPGSIPVLGVNTIAVQGIACIEPKSVNGGKRKLPAGDIVEICSRILKLRAINSRPASRRQAAS